MTAFPKYRTRLVFAGGAVLGTVAIVLALLAGGFAIVSQDELDEQARLIADLRQENIELTDDLLNYQGPDSVFDPNDLPYDADADANSAVASARREAENDGKFLMVTFGANWCIDCRTLHHRLKSDDVTAFTAGLVHFVNVDVGKFNRNLDIARELGVDLSRGIPVAVFFDADGLEVGNTNDGQLEPARFYSSKQILKFVRDIVERSVIAAPDSVE